MRRKALLVTPPTPTRFGPTPPDALRVPASAPMERERRSGTLLDFFLLSALAFSPFAAAVSVSLPLPLRLPLLLRESTESSLLYPAVSYTHLTLPTSG